ncbi:MAG TPA: helix-turn-helix domain-containing protein [Actinophytocola sp.]|uniref:ArsR/SmtB family transcription factor n=1 Tax=Actinophytocola sp. TaxID=1872138 RepID=UPI002DDD635F|nr:helix-turn-helix domain-containing protein [Actinophytocola sp.]HEV2780552.1 helix-turn-helix domain-containing protein [Actinophytocola sp.]
MRIAEVAAVLAEPARASMCLALIDGRAWTVGELARAAGVAPSTGSEHVSKLVKAGFVETLRQGRHRYVRIADPKVAQLIESLAEHAEQRPRRTGLRASLLARRLAAARTCYDHLAGRLGVLLRDGMIDRGLIDVSAGLSITPVGQRVLADLGVTAGRPTNRPLLRDCLDWTERREHLGGAVAAALLNRALDGAWLERGTGRSVRLRPAAREPLAALGVNVDDVAPERSQGR